MAKFMWLDMEMTGLDVEKEVPIEIALIITDEKWTELDQYHAIIQQPQNYLDSMDDWNKKTHGASGLTKLVPEGKNPEIVESEILEIIKKHFSEKDRVVLAGNSIFQDRIFLTKYFKKLSERLHYRMIDVTAFKVVFNNCFRVSYAKPESGHRAINDVRESINELKKYLSYVKF